MVLSEHACQKILMHHLIQKLLEAEGVTVSRMAILEVFGEV